MSVTAEGGMGFLPESTSLNYTPPAKGSKVYTRTRFGNIAEYDGLALTRTSQAKRLGRSMALLVREKRAKGCKVLKVQWFDRNEPDLPFPRIGWKLDMLVPDWKAR